MPSAKIVRNTSSEIKLAKTPYAALANMVPSVVNKILTVELSGANCSLANAIRRTLTSEMPIKHLTVSLTDIMTSDPYVIGEAIRKRLEMIPISQSIDMDTTFAIKIENKTDDCIDVNSHDIKINGVGNSKDIVPSIPICVINSDTFFSINDIHVVESYGFDNARCSIGRVGYEILDQDFTQSSLLTNPDKFKLELEVAGIMNPVELMRKAIDCLIDRLDSIDYSRSIIEFDIFKLTVLNETYSIGRLLSWYIYQLEPSIKYCASRIPHPSKRECVLDIHHPSGEALCKKAAEAIKKDLAAIRKTFA